MKGLGFEAKDLKTYTRRTEHIAEWLVSWPGKPDPMVVPGTIPSQVSYVLLCGQHWVKLKN